MDWSDKRVNISRVPQQAHNYMRKKLTEHGATITGNLDIDTDIVLVPVLHQLEKDVHANYGVDLVGYPEAIADLMDVSFKPCWISKTNLNPSVYTTVVLPEYTKDRTKMEVSDIGWEELEKMAHEMGLAVNQDVHKGNLLVVMPNSCHYNNLEYVRFYLRQRATRSSISFVTMKIFEVAYKDWKRKFPNGVKKLDQETSDIQNRIIGAKWEQVKHDTPAPYIDFSHGILRDYVVIDTEYRNMSQTVNYPVVTEIGAVRVRNGKIVDKFFQIVRNDVFSLREMRRYKGLDLSDAVEANTAYHDLKAFIGDDIIVGHQIYSDLLILGLNLNAVFNQGSLDTLGLIFHELDYDLGVYNLPAIAERYGLHKNSHHALDDAITTYELYEMIVDMQMA